MIDRAAGGTTAYGVMGLRERLQLSSRLSAEGFLQQAAGGAGAFSVGGLQVAYGNGAGLHASAGLQTRGGAGAGTTAALRATGALSSEVSLLGDLELSRSPLVSTGSARLGLAVRPAENGRHVTLLSLERGLGTPQSGDGHSEVALARPPGARRRAPTSRCGWRTSSTATATTPPAARWSTCAPCAR